jgi:hypothetical protein
MISDRGKLILKNDPELSQRVKEVFLDQYLELIFEIVSGFSSGLGNPFIRPA